MKKNLFLVHWLVLTMFLTTVVIGTHAQQLEYPTAKDAIKSVLWELAKDAGKITCPPALMLTAMEILTIDAQAYADVGRGIYWSSAKNRQYEYNWGERVVLVVPPKGKELREVLKEFRDMGCFSEAEIEEIRTMLNYYVSETPLTIDELPSSVQHKINAVITLSVSNNRSEIIEKVKAKTVEKEDVKNKRSCQAFIGEWSWANGGVMTFNAGGSFVWKRGAGEAPISEFNPGTWKCVDEDKGIVFHQAKYGGYQGCFILLDDGKLYNYDCTNNIMGGLTGTRIN